MKLHPKVSHIEMRMGLVDFFYKNIDFKSYRCPNILRTVGNSLLLLNASNNLKVDKIYRPPLINSRWLLAFLWNMQRKCGKVQTNI